MIKRLIFSCALLVILVSSCERDDICAVNTPTTPQLVIQFYDIQNTSEAKPLTVEITEVGNMESYITTDSDTIVSIPLRTNLESTQFTFTKNPGSEDSTQVNTDVVTFTYLTNEEFISRACGFKVTYQNLNATVTNSEEDATRWIRDLQINETLIINDTITHVSIYH